MAWSGGKEVVAGRGTEGVGGVRRVEEGMMGRKWLGQVDAHEG